MRIGFDAKRIVRNGTGLGSYARTLVNDLSAIAPADFQFLLYAPDAGKEELRKMVTTDPNVGWSYPGFLSDALHPSLTDRLRGAYWRTYGLPNDLRRDGVSLYHGLSGELPMGIKKAGIKTVVTIHDLIFLRHPEYYQWLDTKIYAWKFRKTVAEADRIIAISECTKNDILYYSDVQPEKIEVIYQSCDTGFKKCERKNVLLAVKALRQVPEDVSMVIVGRRTPYADTVERFVHDNGLGNRVKLLHGVPFADLPALYQQAEAFVYPSRYEGFGIPVIEAIQSGLPVVACSGSCLEEAGGKENIYVNPDDEKGMAKGICDSLKSAEGREERIARSREYVRRFEGNDVASKVLDIYKRLL